LSEGSFDLERFYGQIGATSKERHALRQDLVRGLKDYYEWVFGYDKYGAETAFLLRERISQPYIFGFAVQRVLRDRRISDETKVGVCDIALEMASYGEDYGIPFGLYAAIHFLLEQQRIELVDLRFALLLTAGERSPFRGLEKAMTVAFFQQLLGEDELSSAERLFWAHSLIARHGDEPGASELIDITVGKRDFPVESRQELCRAWINTRQPRLEVDIPALSTSLHGTFVSERMPFWLTHVPSWPSNHMVRLGLVWLARLGDDPLQIAWKYVGYKDAFYEQIHLAVADILAEHHSTIPPSQLKSLIEQGIAITGSSPTRRKFYRLGTELFGSEYLQRATGDAAGSVRQWASRQLQKQG
jgi:hypothetical protein